MLVKYSKRGEEAITRPDFPLYLVLRHVPGDLDGPVDRVAVNIVVEERRIRRNLLVDPTSKEKERGKGGCYKQVVKGHICSNLFANFFLLFPYLQWKETKKMWCCIFI